MIIEGKPCIVYDVESLPNIFTVTCKNTETQKIITFEISSRMNQIQELREYFLSNNAYFVGYNNKHYDDVVMNYIIHYNIEMKWHEWTQSLHSLSITIINKSKEELSYTTVQLLKKFKYANYFKSIDLLTMLYSKALRVSLKEMQVTMHYHNVQEFVINWQEALPVTKFDELISYNINDVLSTEELLNRCKDKLELRIGIKKEYGIDCLSVDDVNIGMQLLEHEYIKKTGIPKSVLKELRSPCDIIDLEKVILPIVKFKNPVLQQALERMKSQHNVSPGRKGYIDTFLLGDMKVTIGVGGIHGDCGPCIIKPTEDELLIDEDVTSLYPSLMIEHGFYPPHLGKEFLEIYSEIRTKRIEAKRNGNKLLNECFKFCLNGLSGNLQNEYSWAYSPFTVMQIRINGQLLLLMLAERLLELGCKLKQINTDGILFTVPKVKHDEYRKICQEWEKDTKLQLEAEEFSAFYQLAINDYFGVYTDDRIKMKGVFITDTILGKGLQPKIIPKAIINYFVHGITIEETIKDCQNIRDFLQSEKTGKQWQVEYNNETQQRTNRFYASDDGYYLYKQKMINGKPEGEPHNMLKGYGVKLHNVLHHDEDIQWANAYGDTFKDIYKVNYSYYILQCNKIIEQLKPRQLSLWN